MSEYIEDGNLWEDAKTLNRYIYRKIEDNMGWRDEIHEALMDAYEHGFEDGIEKSAKAVEDFAAKGYQGILESDSAYVLSVGEYIKTALLNAAAIVRKKS